jgi:hypothetical protein
MWKIGKITQALKIIITGNHRMESCGILYILLMYYFGGEA